MFDISSLEFVYLQNLGQKLKCLNLRPEILNLGIFGLEFENNIVIFGMSTLAFV